MQCTLSNIEAQPQPLTATAAARTSGSMRAPRADDNDNVDGCKGGIRIAIVSPMTPLSGNLTTAKRLASLLLMMSSAGKGADKRRRRGVGEETAEADDDDGEDSTPPRGLTVECVDIIDSDGDLRSAPTAVGGSEGGGGGITSADVSMSFLPAHLKQQREGCNTVGDEIDQRATASPPPLQPNPHVQCREVYDVCFVIHALRGSKAYLKHFPSAPTPSDSTACSPHQPTNATCSTAASSAQRPLQRPTRTVLIFGGTDVNESPKDPNALAAMSAMMRLINFDAYVCFSEALREEAMSWWGSGRGSSSSSGEKDGGDADAREVGNGPLMTNTNTFIIPQAVDFGDVGVVDTNDGVSHSDDVITARANDGGETVLGALVDALHASFRTTGDRGPSSTAAGAQLHRHPTSNISFLHMGGMRKVKGQDWMLRGWEGMRERLVKMGLRAAPPSLGAACGNVSGSPAQSISTTTHVWLFLVGSPLEKRFLEEEVMPFVDATVRLEEEVVGDENDEGHIDGVDSMTNLDGGSNSRIRALRWVCEWVREPPLHQTAPLDCGVVTHVVWATGIPRSLVPSVLADTAAPLVMGVVAPMNNRSRDTNIPNTSTTSNHHSHSHSHSHHHRLLAVVNTSVSEGQPQTILEAMSMGCVPVIVRDMPGNRSVVRDEGSGYVVADEAALGKAMAEFVFADYSNRMMDGTTTTTTMPPSQPCFPISSATMPTRTPFEEDVAGRVATAKRFVEEHHTLKAEGVAYRHLVAGLMAGNLVPSVE